MNLLHHMVGNKLRKIRIRKKLSLAEAGRKMGMHPANLYKVEKGSKDIRLSTLTKILNGYGITLEQFGRMR